MTLLAIDGPAGAGKTTFAAKLEAELSVDGTVRVIHMDDLYNGWDNALSNPLSEILDRISTAHIAGREFVIKIFNWHIMQFDREEIVTPTDYLIIEGVGSGHTSLRKEVSQAIWVEADENLLLDRVVQRDGEVVRDEMLIWKARERAYFELHEVKKAAQIHLRGQ